MAIRRPEENTFKYQLERSLNDLYSIQKTGFSGDKNILKAFDDADNGKQIDIYYLLREIRQKEIEGEFVAFSSIPQYGSDINFYYNKCIESGEIWKDLNKPERF